MNDSGAGSLQEFSVRALKEAREGLVEVSVPGFREGLCQHSKDGLVGLGPDVVASVEHHWFALMAAQVMGSMAL